MPKQDKYKDEEDEELSKKPSLTSDDIAVLRTYGNGPYGKGIKTLESDIKRMMDDIRGETCVKESDTGIAPPNLWNLKMDGIILKSGSHYVAKVIKILHPEDLEVSEDDSEKEEDMEPEGYGNNEYNPDFQDDGNDDIYMISLRNISRYIVNRNQKLPPTDIDEDMRVAIDKSKLSINVPLPMEIDPTVAMMELDSAPEVTYADIGGCEEQISLLRQMIEEPMLHPDRFLRLGIDPPKGVMLYGPPGTGKTLTAKAVAHHTNSCFLRVIGSELVQRYVGEGARIVRELFTLAKLRSPCIIFFDEVDAFGLRRSESAAETGDSDVQRTMLELINQLDGFESRGNIKVIMATNRPDILDPALTRPGRLDRKIEYELPDLNGRAEIFKINCGKMSVVPGIRYELLARHCPGATGADIKAVCTEAGMFAIRDRRRAINEEDFLNALEKVIKGQKKFSATAKYMEIMT